jgi:hypothetical protein
MTADNTVFKTVAKLSGLFSCYFSVNWCFLYDSSHIQPLWTMQRRKQAGKLKVMDDFSPLVM